MRYEQGRHAHERRREARNFQSDNGSALPCLDLVSTKRKPDLHNLPLDRPVIRPWRWVGFGLAMGLAIGAVIADFVGPPANPVLVPVALVISGIVLLGSGYLSRVA